MGRIKEAFQGSGLDGHDVWKAVVAHEVIGAAFAATMWGVRTCHAPFVAYVQAATKHTSSCYHMPVIYAMLANACIVVNTHAALCDMGVTTRHSQHRLQAVHCYTRAE